MKSLSIRWRPWGVAVDVAIVLESALAGDAAAALERWEENGVWADMFKQFAQDPDMAAWIVRAGLPRPGDAAACTRFT